jgi:hypothetical protein
MELYAANAAWIDHESPEGIARLHRILRDPGVLDARFSPVLSRVAWSSVDPSLPPRALHAAGRIALAEDDLPRAETVGRRMAVDCVRTVGELQAPALALLALSLASQRREHERLSVQVRMDACPRRQAADDVYLTGFRAATSALLDEWHAALRTSAEPEAVSAAIGRVDGIHHLQLEAVRSARCAREIGDLALARKYVEIARRGIPAEGRHRNHLFDVAATEVRLLLSEGREPAARALAEALASDPSLPPRRLAEAFLLRASAEAVRGDERAARSTCASVATLLRIEPHRFGTGTTIRFIADILRYAGGEVPGDPELANTAADAIAARIVELARWQRDPDGAAVLDDAGRRRLAVWRRSAAPEYASVVRLAGPVFGASPHGRSRGVEEILAPYYGGFRCSSCHTLWKGADEQLPVAHLLPAALVSPFPESPCPPCRDA